MCSAIGVIYYFTSTAIANQLPGQLVYIQIITRGPNCFKFITALINGQQKHCTNRRVTV